MDKGYVITSVLNTSEQEVEIPSREVQLIELEGNDKEDIARIGLTGSARTGLTKVVVGQRES